MLQLTKHFFVRNVEKILQVILMNTKNKQIINVYESFLFIVALTMIGGFMNAYTYVLHDGYLSTMNTGNMARMGIAITELRFSDASSYLMSIFANAFGAMLAFITRKVFADNLPKFWQRKCLVAEIIIFCIVGLLPLTLPHWIVNCTISIMAGFQLASFTSWEGNVVSTTIASGNVRLMGEYLGDMVLSPNMKNLRKFLLFVLITASFIMGVIIGALTSRALSQYSIYIPVLVITAMLLIDYFTSNKNK